jgi:xanthine/uracil permease
MIRLLLLLVFGGWFAYFAVRAVIAAGMIVLDMGQGGHNAENIMGAMLGSMVLCFLFAWLFKRAYRMKPPAQP